MFSRTRHSRRVVPSVQETPVCALVGVLRTSHAAGHSACDNGPRPLYVHAPARAERDHGCRSPTRDQSDAQVHVPCGRHARLLL